MPAKRNNLNKRFPAGWRWMNGKIRYRVPKGMEHLWDNKTQFTLGKTETQAYQVWALRVGHKKNVTTIGDLLDRYLAEVTIHKPPHSRREEKRYSGILRLVFADMALTDIKPQDIYKYISERKSPVSARREKAMLSHAYTKAVEWGLIDRHPFKGEVRLPGEKPRQRYVTDAEIDAVMAMEKKHKSDPIIWLKAYIGLKRVMPIRKGDMLRLNVNKFTGQGIPVIHQKTGKSVIFGWTPERLKAVEECKAANPKDICQWLFCNRNGQPYFNDEKGTTSGFDSIWQRFMARVEEAGIERFTEHDIRAKAGSDAESDERAKQLLGHMRVETTVRAYRRKPEIVK